MNWERLLTWDSTLLSRLSPLSHAELYNSDGVVHSYPDVHDFMLTARNEFPELVDWDSFVKRAGGMSSYSNIPTGAEFVEQYAALPPARRVERGVTRNAQALLLNKSLSTTGLALDFFSELGLAERRLVDYPLTDLITSESLSLPRLERREKLLPKVFAYFRRKRFQPSVKQNFLDLFSLDVGGKTFLRDYNPRSAFDTNLFNDFDSRVDGPVDSSVLEQLVEHRMDRLVGFDVIRNGGSVYHAASGLDDSYPVCKQVPFLGVTPEDTVHYPSIHLDNDCRGELKQSSVLDAVHYGFATTPKKRYSLDDLGGSVVVGVEVPDPNNFVLGVDDEWSHPVRLLECERCGEKVLPIIRGA